MNDEITHAWKLGVDGGYDRLVSDPIEVGQFIKERREALGLTQEQLAQKCGTTKTSVQSWEAGKHAIRKRYHPRLAQALRVSDEARFDSSAELATSGMLPQPPTVPDLTARDVLYEFLDSDLAASLDPPLSAREIAWLLDHHVDGQVTPEYFWHAIGMERARVKAPPPPSDRPNEAAGAAERAGLKRRDVVSQKKPARRS